MVWGKGSRNKPLENHEDETSWAHQDKFQVKNVSGSISLE